MCLFLRFDPELMLEQNLETNLGFFQRIFFLSLMFSFSSFCTFF